MLASDLETNFDVVCSVTTKLDITYTKYRSRKTGLSVVLIDVEAPLVDGHFVLATETSDDYGYPHTLEHLVFFGSEQYPYKGILDSLANRAIAKGTNAWTDIDSTCYTITTAGSEGFLKLMPVFVDHILYPTLTEAACYTEVHHINGHGEDAGVVYSEMQARQNSAGSYMELRMRRVMYPESCGYHYDTLGLMERLREISVDQIRNYHKSFYRPDNLCLIITGKVKYEDLMAALVPIEKKIICKGILPPMQRPWVHTGNCSDLQKNMTETVFFADAAELVGSVHIVWNGPEYHEWLEATAIRVLNNYLTQSQVAVLQQKLVEIEDPICTDIFINMMKHMKSTIELCGSNIPYKYIDNFADQVFATLQSIVHKEEFDMERMKMIIHNEILKVRSEAEYGPAFATIAGCIDDFKYGALDGHQMGAAIMEIEYFEQLRKFKKQDWLSLLKRVFLDKHHIVLLGKPSKKLADVQAEEERIRVAKRRVDLGEAKLAELDKTLKECIAINDTLPPKDLIENFKIPAVSNIHFFDVVTARNNVTSKLENKVQEYINMDNDANIPLFIQFDHIKSYFVRIAATLSTSSIPIRLLPYTRIFQQMIFALPMEKHGNIIPYEEVVKGLNEDLLEYTADFGVGGVCPGLIVLAFKAEASKYAKSIEWMYDVLLNTRFTSERVSMTAKQLLNCIPQEKREGHTMVYASMNAVQNDATKSAYAADNILYQADFLEKILKKTEEDPATILAELNEYRNALCQPKNIRLHVIGDILRLDRPRTSFKQFFSENVNVNRALAPITFQQDSLTPTGKNPGKTALIINLPSIENSYSVHCAKGPRTFDDPDIPPLMVLLEMLNTMEGIFWKLIRGKGLAYSCSLSQNTEKGLMEFAINRSPDAFKAFEQAKFVINQLASGKLELNPLDIDGAKSGVIFNVVNQEGSMEGAGITSFVNQVFKQVPASHSKNLLAAVQAVKMEDLIRVLKTYLVSLFHPNTSNVFVVSCPNKIEDICTGFRQSGFTLQKKSLDDIAQLSPFIMRKTFQHTASTPEHDSAANCDFIFNTVVI